MHSNRMSAALLAAVVLFACGASTEGVEQARQWMYQGDLARVGKLNDVAYQFYLKVAETFPNTPHGRSAAIRAEQMRRKALWVNSSPATETPENWVAEVFDFLIWP